jgi:hypothetical protein
MNNFVKSAPILKASSNSEALNTSMIAYVKCSLTYFACTQTLLSDACTCTHTYTHYNLNIIKNLAQSFNPKLQLNCSPTKYINGISIIWYNNYIKVTTLSEKQNQNRTSAFCKHKWGKMTGIVCSYLSLFCVYFIPH